MIGGCAVYAFEPEFCFFGVGVVPMKHLFGYSVEFYDVSLHVPASDYVVYATLFKGF